ncbi:DUF4062 domain-containing protein [Candidatus Binatia bacterium]|nr:DUF4062 domain-containing protein [Candidatus Binatia bacterium]
MTISAGGIERRTPARTDVRRTTTMQGRAFLSYTANDLRQHAEIVKRAVRDNGWEAIDHRDWAATGRPSVSECHAQVDRCDVLIVLSGARYGWVPSRDEGGDGHKSITWLEVERARSRGIPVLPLLLDDRDFNALLESRDDERRQLEAFRHDLKRTVVGTFSTDPTPLSELVKRSLDDWDGRKHDFRVPWRRRARLAAPILLAAWALAAWTISVPDLQARRFRQPLPEWTWWIRQPASIIVAALCVGFVVFWWSRAGRGRPQLMYRVFPLTRLGDAGVLACVVASLGLAAASATSFGAPESRLEEELARFVASGRRDALVAWNPDEWRHARFRSDVAALHEYVLPVLAARKRLGRDQSLAAARDSLRTLPAPDDPPIDPRVAMLVELARVHSLAILQNAGRALEQYHSGVAPRLPQLPSVWRAEARLALAEWIDVWAFTNILEQLDRSGAPKFEEADVLREFDAAIRESDAKADRPTWVDCAALTSRCAAASRLCGVDGTGPCVTLVDDVRLAIRCNERREDPQAVQEGKHNLGLVLLAKGEQNEPYKLFREAFESTGDPASGLQALALETFRPVAPAGQLLDPAALQREIDKDPDRRRRTELSDCVRLLKNARAGSDPGDAAACRAAFACFLTDSPVANEAFCGVPEVATEGAEEVSPHATAMAARGGSRFRVRGEAHPTQPATNLVDGCDGDVEPSPSVTVKVGFPARILARVDEDGTPTGDPVLVMRGQQIAQCADDSPIPGVGRSSGAGIRTRVAAGTYELYVGNYKDSPLRYDLRIELAPEAAADAVAIDSSADGFARESSDP